MTKRLLLLCLVFSVCIVGCSSHPSGGDQGVVSLLESGASKWQSAFGEAVGKKGMRGGGQYLDFKKGDVSVGVGFSGGDLPQLVNVSLASSKRFADVSKAAGLPADAKLGSKDSQGVFTQVDRTGLSGWKATFVETNPQAAGQLIFKR